MKWTIDGAEIEFDEKEARRQPDWDHGSMLSGGHLAEIPPPHIREFPGPNRREVRIFIMRYPVGVHYSARIEVERNAVWNPLTKAEAHPSYEEIQSSDYGSEVTGWQRSWDDPEGEYETFNSPRSRSRTWAERWVRIIIERHFAGAGSWEIRGQHGQSIEWLTDDQGRYLYMREGD